LFFNNAIILSRSFPIPTPVPGQPAAPAAAEPDLPGARSCHGAAMVHHRLFAPALWWALHGRRQRRSTHAATGVSGGATRARVSCRII